jgi:hypothetical protein
VIHKVHFSREFISKLKAQASTGLPRPYSTLQCVVAHLWRSMTTARGLEEGQSTSVCIAVDGRARMSLQVPDGYTGNVVLWARPTTKAGELVARPLQHAVGLINREVARINDAYFKSFIDFATSGAVEKERLVAAADAEEMVLSPNIEVDSWLRIPFYDLDFGGGRAGGVAQRPAGTGGAGSICFCIGSIWFWRGSHRFGGGGEIPSIEGMERDF